MPQLDFSNWIGQIFWLVLTFTVLHMLLITIVLPRMQSIYQRREQKISGDVKRAEALQLEAQNILDSYTKALSDAREDASNVIVDTTLKAEKAAQLRIKNVTTEIEEKTRSVLRDIEKVKEECLSNTDNSVIHISHDILQKILQRKFEEKTLKKVLETFK